jgi:tetratricopeptide (TPR) repeat protein
MTRRSAWFLNASLITLIAFPLAASPLPAPLRDARDKQDKAALEKIAGERAQVAASKANDAAAQYQHAVAELVLAEVALELRDKGAAAAAAERGIASAQKAVALKPTEAEYHRVQGTLCGQIIPANVLKGLKYGRCAQEEINKAIELNAKSAEAYLSRGVGNYYLPPSFGGGLEIALKDIDKAISLEPSNADAYLWKGIVLRKANRAAEARTALEKALKLNPQRGWIKQQLEKTPAS